MNRKTEQLVKELQHLHVDLSATKMHLKDLEEEIEEIISELTKPVIAVPEDALEARGFGART